MFFGGINLECNQQVVIYDAYEMINVFEEEEKALMRIEDSIRFYVNKYGKNRYRAEGLLRYFQGIRLRFPTENCSIIVAPVTALDSISVKTYNPLDDLSSLFIDLSKMESVLDERALLKFVNLYGLSARGQWLFDYSHIDIPLLYLDDFEKELASYKKYFKLFLAYKNGDHNLMMRLIRNNSINFNSRIETKDEISSVVKTALVSKIKSRAIKYDYFFDTDRSFMKVGFKDLFDVAYFQIGRNLFNDEPLGICMECGNLFVKSHGNMKFCPAPPNARRSSCQNNHQVKVYRKKIKQ